MSILLTSDKKEIIVTCNCGCRAAFNIAIDDSWKDDDYYAFLCFMKANYDTEYDLTPWRAFKVKARKIWTILRGKDYCYSDVIMSKEEFQIFKEFINQF